MQECFIKQTLHKLGVGFVKQILNRLATMLCQTILNKLATMLCQTNPEQTWNDLSNKSSTSLQ
jgi:hypothetical protein